MQALVEMRDFNALDGFARSKRSPIGYEPFVRLLLDNGHQREAVSYIPRCDAGRRVDLYIECDEWRMAGKECKDRGNKARLECVDFSSVSFSILTVLIYFTPVKPIETDVSKFADCSRIGPACGVNGMKGYLGR